MSQSAGLTVVGWVKPTDATPRHPVVFNELGRRLRTIERIAAGCRAARADEEQRAFRQLTIGQFMLLVALWALGLAAWRLTW
jgi:hypothetical protein